MSKLWQHLTGSSIHHMHSLTGSSYCVWLLKTYGHLLSSNGNCDKGESTRSEKANVMSTRTCNIWKCNMIKHTLYKTIILLATLQHGSERWNLTKANLKFLEAANHRWHRKILGTIWKIWSQMKQYIGLKHLAIHFKFMNCESALDSAPIYRHTVLVNETSGQSNLT